MINKTLVQSKYKLQARTLVVSGLPGNPPQHSKGEGLIEREVGMHAC